jgi:hypothetical protein
VVSLLSLLQAKNAMAQKAKKTGINDFIQMILVY